VFTFVWFRESREDGPLGAPRGPFVSDAFEEFPYSVWAVGVFGVKLVIQTVTLFELEKVLVAHVQVRTVGEGNEVGQGSGAVGANGIVG
jgi:hypothetical protein